MHHIACSSHSIHHGLQIIRILLHRLESLIFLGTKSLNLLHPFIFLCSIGISLPDEFFLAHISISILLIKCNALFYDFCFFCTQLFFLPFQCGEANQRFAFPFVQDFQYILCLLYLRCQRISDDMFQQFLGDRDSLARAVHRCGRKSAVKRWAKFLENTIFHQFLAIATVDLSLQRILAFCVVPCLMISMLQHNDLLRLYKFFWGHNSGMAVLDSYLLFQGSAQDPMFARNRHNEFRAHVGSLILLIFQYMVNHSACPVAALQVPCFLLAVHMVFRHMIHCRGWNLLFVQDFCDGPRPVSLQCQFKNQAHILAGYRV